MISSVKLQSLVLRHSSVATFVAYNSLEYSTAIVRMFISDILEKDSSILETTPYFELQRLFDEYMKDRKVNYKKV